MSSWAEANIWAVQLNLIFEVQLKYKSKKAVKFRINFRWDKCQFIYLWNPMWVHLVGHRRQSVDFRPFFWKRMVFAWVNFCDRMNRWGQSEPLCFHRVMADYIFQVLHLSRLWDCQFLQIEMMTNEDVDLKPRGVEELVQQHLSQIFVFYGRVHFGYWVMKKWSSFQNHSV